jgi:erythromycin esterase-like protein
MKKSNQINFSIRDFYLIQVLPYLCFLFFGVETVFGQTLEDLFDLRFQSAGQKYDNLSWLCSRSNVIFSLDSTYPAKNQLPLLIEKTAIMQRHSMTTRPSDELNFDLEKTIVLPPYNKGKSTCEVSVRSKCEVDSLLFSVAVLKNAKQIYADSMYIREEKEWNTHSIRFTLNGAEALSVSFRYYGEREKFESRKIALNNVRIQIGDADINSFPVSVFSEKANRQWKKDAVVPLSFSDINSLSGIKKWKNKRLVAIGKSMYGSQEVNEACLQFIRYLVTEENSRIIVFEVPIDIVLRWDLYVQGVISEDFEDELTEDLKSCFENYRLSLDFLKWVRDYNANRTDKVRVFGMGNINQLDEDIYFADYFLKMSKSPQDSLFYLECIAGRDFDRIKDRIGGDPEWQTLVNESDRRYLLSLVDERIAVYTARQSHSLENYHIQNQSFNMYEKVNKINELYSTPTGKIILYAHTLLTHKKPFLPVPNPDYKSVGCYLQEKYGNDYYSITFQAGEGYHTKDSTFIYGSNMTVPLPVAPGYSFERNALNHLPDYFYIPVEKIPESVLSLNIYDRIRPNRFSRYCYFPEQFDALVFIRKSSALQFVEKHMSAHFSRMAYQKLRNINASLKNLRKSRASSDY